MEKVPKSTIPDIDKKKFLVPADLSGRFHSLSHCVFVSCFGNIYTFTMRSYIIHRYILC